MQRFEVAAPCLTLFAGSPEAACLYDLLLWWIARDHAVHRPQRIEPRIVKRRPKPYKLLNHRRNQMREAPLR